MTKSVLAVLSTVVASGVTPKLHPLINDVIVNQVVESGILWDVWEPQSNPLRSYTQDELTQLCGTIISHEPLKYKGAVQDSSMPSPPGPFPSDFDSRLFYPKCRHKIRNQGHCGSCWAMAVTETWEDNACVNNTGASSPVTEGEQFAVEQILACDHFGPNSDCKGGQPGYAWDFVVDQGLVTESCMPYVSFNKTVDACPPEIGPDTSVCPGGKALKWKGNKCKTQLQLMSNQYNDSAWMNAIQKLGAIQTDYLVYQDFLQYKGGVYKHTNMSQQALGGHAIKIVGWGVINATSTTAEQPYWTVANSWGETWGEEGYFRIWRGQNLSDAAFMGHAGAYACGQELPSV